MKSNMRTSALSAPGASSRGDSSPLRVLWRRRGTLLVFLILGLIAGGLYLAFAQRIYTVSARVYVTRPASAATTEGNKSAELFHATQAQLFKSTPVLALATVKPGTDDLQTFANVRSRTTFLKEHLDVQAGRNDELITISLSTAHPEEGKRIIDAVIDAYAAFQKDQKQVQVDQVIDTLRQEKERVDGQLAETIARLTEARARNASIGTGEDEQPVPGGNRRLDTLQEALAKAEIDTIDRKAAYTAAVASLGVDDPTRLDAALPPGPVTDAEIEVIRQETSSLQRKLAEQSRIYLPTHPAIKGMQERIDLLNLQYVAGLRQKLVQAQQRENDVRKSVNDELQLATGHRQAAEQIRALAREQERLTNTADQLDRRIKEASLTVDSGLITVRVTEPPDFNSSSFHPNAAAVLPAGCLLGLALGSIVALIRESANPRLATPEGARAALALPVLGTIPTSSMRTIESFGWSVHADAAGEAAEAFRAVRTSLQFSLAESGGRRVLITSADQMDGKSTLASNLAIALAKSGKNVLLIDANLRDPSQHRIFGVSDAVGVVDVLSSGELNERAIRRTTIERLHIMPAGNVPQNPSELLNSPALPELLDQAGRTYDVVLVDTPAVGLVDDARIVAASCDGAVLVVRSGKTNRRFAAAARDGLLSVGCPVLGVVINGCRVTGAGAYGPSAASRRTGANAPDSRAALDETADDASIAHQERSI